MSSSHYGSGPAVPANPPHGGLSPQPADPVLPPQFSIIMPDDSMSPTLKKGWSLNFSTTRKPMDGRVILVRQVASGEVYLCEFREQEGGFLATFTNPGYGPGFDSRYEELAILAVCFGYDEWVPGRLSDSEGGEA